MRAAIRDVWIGTSGWAYPEWRGGFYAGVPRPRWLAHYARHFEAVEVNATFYRALRPATLEGWRAATPDAFRFCLKASRVLTHVERLDFPEAALARFRAQTDALGHKLAAVLWQLPARFPCDLERLARFAERLDAWPAVRHAVEPRDPSWFTDAVAARLAAHRLAAVQSHAADWPLWDAVTTDLVYVRLHGGVRTYRSPYTAATLARWAARIRRWVGEGRAVHVYFDNTAEGHAVANALALRRLLAAPDTPRAARP